MARFGWRVFRFFLFVFLIVLLIPSTIHRLEKYDLHQLTPSNTEKHPGWGSSILETVENIFYNCITLVYNREAEHQHYLTIDYPVMIQPKKSCGGRDSREILILIFSFPKDKDSRIAIRKTWLQRVGRDADDVQHVFLLGQSPDEVTQQELLIENRQFGDLLQHDFMDTQRNMTLKIINGFRWVAKHCQGSQYVMKVDSDIWLNIPLWQELMFSSHKQQLQKVVFGHCRRTAAVVRLPFHRYALSVTTYPASHYHPYCHGPAYALSYKLVQDIAKFSYRSKYIPMEDVYIGYTIKTLGYKVYNPPGIKIQELPYILSNIHENPCILTKDLYIVHAVKRRDQYKLWQLVSKVNC